MRTLVVTILAVIFAVAANAVVIVEEGVEKSEVVTLTARLNTTMALTLDNSPITFEFNTLDEYKNGLGGIKGDYRSAGSVSSTSNWKLSYKANDAFTHADGETVMPLDNVGLSAAFTGSNKVSNKAADAPLALSSEKREIIGHDGNNSNAGDDEANAFVIYWEMGTAKGDMNSKSIFEQDLKKGEYQTQVEFIATEVL